MDAFAICVNAPSGYEVVAGVSLQVLYPYNDLDEVQAFAVESSPVGLDWDFIVAQAICAF